jgi:hypothetical protein
VQDCRPQHAAICKLQNPHLGGRSSINPVWCVGASAGSKKYVSGQSSFGRMSVGITPFFFCAVSINAVNCIHRNHIFPMQNVERHTWPTFFTVYSTVITETDFPLALRHQFVANCWPELRSVSPWTLYRLPAHVARPRARRRSWRDTGYSPLVVLTEVRGSNRAPRR